MPKGNAKAGTGRSVPKTVPGFQTNPGCAIAKGALRASRQMNRHFADAQDADDAGIASEVLRGRKALADRSNMTQGRAQRVSKAERRDEGTDDRDDIPFDKAPEEDLGGTVPYAHEGDTPGTSEVIALPCPCFISCHCLDIFPAIHRMSYR